MTERMTTWQAKMTISEKKNTTPKMVLYVDGICGFNSSIFIANVAKYSVFMNPHIPYL